jgi:quercetin dioxygenase-like cupin family protein
MKTAILASALLLTAAAPIPAPADAPKPPETVTRVFAHDLPNVPGKAMFAFEVDYPAGASSPAHTHPKSAFIYAYVLSGAIVSAVDGETPRTYRAGEGWYEAPGAHHRVSRNASATQPAKLLAVFVMDPTEQQLVIPEPQ